MINNIPKGYNLDGEYTGSADPTDKLKELEEDTEAEDVWTDYL